MISPALNFDPELLLKAQGICVVFLDVDGVLTDGGLYFTPEAKRSNGSIHSMAMVSNCCKGLALLR